MISSDYKYIQVSAFSSDELKFCPSGSHKCHVILKQAIYTVYIYIYHYIGLYIIFYTDGCLLPKFTNAYNTDKLGLLLRLVRPVDCVAQTQCTRHEHKFLKKKNPSSVALTSSIFARRYDGDIHRL